MDSAAPVGQREVVVKLKPGRIELSAVYGTSGYDPLVPRDLLIDEIAQRRETGFDVDEIVIEANRTDPDDSEALLRLVDLMAGSERTSSWPYDEPDALEDIQSSSTIQLSPIPVAPGPFTDQVHAAWLGRVAGCNLGKPVEEGRHWTPERIREYLELAGAYPLRDYFPVLDPMPDRFHLRDNWPDTTRGNIDGSARDDDIDYSILALQLLETHGRLLRPANVADAWTSLFPLRQLFTAERAAYVNLINGFTPPRVARHRNPYREWIGAQIRGDVFGYVFAGNPSVAASTAYQDASLSHVGNGIYGEMWAAALVAAAFTASSAREAIVVALNVIPPRSRLSEAVNHVLELHAANRSWEEALGEIRARYGHYAWVHTINNAALVAAGLLWGDGDFLSSVSRTVLGGWDTDSNGATVGSVAGILAGTAGLPEQLIAPLHDTTRSALFGWDNSRISDLAERTIALAGRLGT